MTGDEAIAHVEAAFPEAVRQLRGSGRLIGPVPMVAAAREVRAQAGRAWRFAAVDRESHFSIANAQAEVRFDRRLMGGVLARAMDLVLETRDAAVSAAVGALPEADRPAVLAGELMKLFLAHEFLHVRQQLGSSQYRDSDHYAATVTPVDYQADVAALWHVSRYGGRPAGLDARGHLVLLAALHVATMYAFVGDAAELDRLSFDRLLIWHLQLARFASSQEEPDMTHASVQAMPVIAFPRVDGAIASLVSAARVAAVGNDRPDVLADMVLTMADGDGLLTVLRFPSTDRDRVAEIVAAVMAGDFAAVRDALDELRVFLSVALDFAPVDRTRIAVEQATSLADALLSSGVTLSLADRDVLRFFGEAERLVFQPRPPLAGEGVDDMRGWWAAGINAWLDGIAAAMPTGGDPAMIEHAAVTREIYRVASRLGSSLD